MGEPSGYYEGGEVVTKPADIVAAVRKLLSNHRPYPSRGDRVCIDVDVDAFVSLVAKLHDIGSLPVERPASRRLDPPTSAIAGDEIREHLSEIQAAIVYYLSDGKEASARQIERYPAFTRWGFSTVRKRVSELASAGWLESCGVETKSGTKPSTVYRLTVEAGAVIDIKNFHEVAK